MLSLTSVSMTPWATCEERVPSGGTREIERDAFLARVQEIEERGRAAAAAVGPARALDLDDAGAGEMQQVSRQRSCPERGEIDDEGRALRRRRDAGAARADPAPRRRAIGGARRLGRGEAEQAGAGNERARAAPRGDGADDVPRIF